MAKKQLGAVNSLYPMPTTLVGATVNGKPNYITIAHVGIMDMGTISLGMNKVHYTNAGIKENKTFSVNLPSVNLIKETDYCGLVSGKKTDKAALFDNFYGVLGTAPMIRQCPVNMECRLVQTVDFPNHDIFVGEVVETYVDEDVLTNNVLDVAKVQPILFTMADHGYWAIGSHIGQAWNVGKELKKKG